MRSSEMILSGQQLEIAALLILGLRDKDILGEFRLTPAQLVRHNMEIYRLTGCKGRLVLARKYYARLLPTGILSQLDYLLDRLSD